jgi:hypothetical protein
MLKQHIGLSIDNPNGLLSYGKYYINKSLTLMQGTLKKKTRQGTWVWKVKPQYDWLDRLRNVEDIQDRTWVSRLGPPVEVNLHQDRKYHIR